MVGCNDSAQLAMFGVIHRCYSARIEERVLARDEDHLDNILEDKDAKK